MFETNAWIKPAPECAAGPKAGSRKRTAQCAPVEANRWRWTVLVRGFSRQHHLLDMRGGDAGPATAGRCLWTVVMAMDRGDVEVAAIFDREFFELFAPDKVFVFPDIDVGEWLAAPEFLGVTKRPAIGP